MQTKRPQTAGKRNASTAKSVAIARVRSVTDAATPLIDIAEARARAQLAIIEDSEGRGFDKDVAMATAALLRSLVSSEGERRQRAKQDARALDSFSLEQITDYLKSKPDLVRDQVCQELSGANEEESLL